MRGGSWAACAASPEHEPVIGQRGRQRAILREGVYAINLALFTVITEDTVYRLETGGSQGAQGAGQLAERAERERRVQPGDHRRAGRGARPAQSRARRSLVDSIGIVTVHDGPSLPPGEIIAPGGRAPTATTRTSTTTYQDPEAFLRAGGRRGLQYVPLTDGTYFINRWFATIESIPKTIVPIGYVGVVVSYYGRSGQDLSGQAFRHGERVAEGERGVLEKPLGPGKYAFNTYAGNIVLVPTTNFVLHWVTGRTESHRYDESLRSIDLVTKDAYEPTLPLSVVVHIDYQKAPERDPAVRRRQEADHPDARPDAQRLLPRRGPQADDARAAPGTRLDPARGQRASCGRKFHNFDIECVDVLIGKPDTAEAGGKIETLLEQLRLRQLSLEQVETYSKQVTAAEKLRVLNEAQAQAQMQTQLTNSLVQIRIAENEAEAQLARARKQAEQVVVTAAGREPGADPGRPRRRRPHLAGGVVRSVGLAPEDRVVLRSAAVRPVGRGAEPGEVHAAAGPRAGLHRRGRRRQRRGRRQRPHGRGRRGRRQRADGPAPEPAGRREVRIPVGRALG